MLNFVAIVLHQIWCMFLLQQWYPATFDGKVAILVRLYGCDHWLGKDKKKQQIEINFPQNWENTLWKSIASENPEII